MEPSSPSLLHANQQCSCTTSRCCREFGETGKSLASGDYSHFREVKRGRELMCCIAAGTRPLLRLYVETNLCSVF